MAALLRRLNDLPIFDPARWPAREAIARTVGCLAVGAFLLRRILQLPQFPGCIHDVDFARAWFAKLSFLPPSLLAPPFDLERYYAYYGYVRQEIVLLWWSRAAIWTLETGILVGYIVAFLTRDRARSVAKGFMETVFPLLLAGLPFAIVMTPYTYHRWFPEHVRSHLRGLYAINLVLIAAGALNVVGLFTLRRSFTIMTEARGIVRTGLYRLIRHPLYAAHFVIYFCYTLLHFHPATAGIYAAFVAGQTWRARLEERKLTATFPEYEEYRRETGMFLPRLRIKN